MSERDSQAQCPFCKAPWSEAMFAALDRVSVEGCACCAGPHVDAVQQSMPEAEEDICCDSCGKALYRVGVRSRFASSNPA